jgi:hypothetical protein
MRSETDESATSNVKEFVELNLHVTVVFNIWLNISEIYELI